MHGVSCRDQLLQHTELTLHRCQDLARKSKEHKQGIITTPASKSSCQIFHWHQTLFVDVCKTISLEETIPLGKERSCPQRKQI